MSVRHIAQVSRKDPGTGVERHADAGYEIAKRCAQEMGLKLPMLGGEVPTHRSRE